MILYDLCGILELMGILEKKRKSSSTKPQSPHPYYYCQLSRAFFSLFNTHQEPTTKNEKLKVCGLCYSSRNSPLRETRPIPWPCPDIPPKTPGFFATLQTSSTRASL